MKIKLAAGATTSDKNILKREIVKKVIYKKAEQMIVGANALLMESADALDLRFSLPKETAFTAEKSAEGARVKRSRLEWFEINKIMEKYQCDVLITDESKARQLEKNQTRQSMNAASRGMAIAKDADIFTVLAAGAGANGAATACWDDVTNSDPAADVSKAVASIMKNTTLLETELKNINVFYPAELFAYLTSLQEIENIHRSVMDYMKSQWGIGFYPTRQLADDVLVVVKSEEAAFHYVYSGSDIPTSEEERITGVGDSYLITQYFKTFIVPEAEGGTTNNRIYKITNVVT